MPHLISALPLFLASILPAAAAAAEPVQSWFAEQGYVAPANGSIVACHGYGCVRRTLVAVDGSWFVRAEALLRAGRSSPDAERQALSSVVRLYTAHLAAQFGGEPDAPRSPPAMSGKNGQMDCVDESTNTTSLLLVLQNRGLLVHHEVERPQTRGLFIDGRYPHTTAVIAEKKTGTEWAIDPWTTAPGGKPDILPLSQWRQES